LAASITSLEWSARGQLSFNLFPDGGGMNRHPRLVGFCGRVLLEGAGMNRICDCNLTGFYSIPCRCRDEPKTRSKMTYHDSALRQPEPEIILEIVVDDDSLRKTIRNFFLMLWSFWLFD